jgi:hypothetical protein
LSYEKIILGLYFCYESITTKQEADFGPIPNSARFLIRPDSKPSIHIPGGQNEQYGRQPQPEIYDLTAAETEVGQTEYGCVGAWGRAPETTVKLKRPAIEDTGVWLAHCATDGVVATGAAADAAGELNGYFVVDLSQ